MSKRHTYRHPALPFFLHFGGKYSIKEPYKKPTKKSNARVRTVAESTYFSKETGVG